MKTTKTTPPLKTKSKFAKTWGNAGWADERDTPGDTSNNSKQKQRLEIWVSASSAFQARRPRSTKVARFVLPYLRKGNIGFYKRTEIEIEMDGNGISIEYYVAVGPSQRVCRYGAVGTSRWIGRRFGSSTVEMKRRRVRGGTELIP